MAADEALLGTLEELRNLLQVRHNPDRRAFSMLKPNRYGSVKLAYTEEAFSAWAELLERHPGNHRPLHHLAIMHHARAFDLERSADPTQSDVHWQTALALWHRLWLDDGLWEALAGRLEEGPQNPVAHVRERWPVQLLQVHFDLALSDQCKHYRALQHVALALDSPFPAELKDEVRRRSYDRLTGHLSPDVWAPHTFAPDMIKPGLESICRYLEYDPGFVTALCDLLALLTKLQTGYVQQINATETEEDSHARMSRMRAVAAEYDPYLLRLEEHLGALSPDALSNLVVWHSRTGQLLGIMGNYAPAARHYHRARQVAAQDDGLAVPGQEAREGWLKSLLLHARERASALTRDNSGEEEARQVLASLADEPLDSGLCLFLRGNTWMHLGELARAQEDCQAALEKLAEEQLAVDPGVAGEARELEPVVRRLAQRVRDQRCAAEAQFYIDEAQREMVDGHLEAALVFLNQAEANESATAAVLFLRARCLFDLGRPAEAAVDASRAEGAAEAAGDGGALTMIRKIQAEIAAAPTPPAAQSPASGSDSAADLWPRALAAHTSGRSSEAKTYIDTVLGKDPSFFPALLLRAELHLEGGDPDRAVDEAVRLARLDALSPEERRAAQSLKARAMLSRAQQLVDDGAPDEALVDLEWILQRGEVADTDPAAVAGLKARALLARLRHRPDWLSPDQALTDAAWVAEGGRLSEPERAELDHLRALLLFERAQHRLASADRLGAAQDVALALECPDITADEREALQSLRDSLAGGPWPPA